MLAKRNILTLWLLLVGAEWLLATQTWYKVLYTFDGTQKTLLTAGLNAWSAVNGLIMFSLVGLVAVMLTRGTAARIVTAVVALASAAITSFAVSAFSTDVPPAVNGAIEKASGVAGGAANGISDAIQAVTDESSFIWTFALVAILVVVVQLGAAIGAKDWAAKPRVDKYTVNRTKAGSDDAANVDADSDSAADSDANPKAKKASKTANIDDSSKGRNIQLWDSQR